MESYVLDFSEDDLYDLDLEIDIEMPETPVTHRGRGRHSYSNRPSYGGKNHGHNADTKNRRRGRSALFHNEHEEDYMDDDDVKDGEADQDPQEKLCESLKPHLTEVSSQRLRCLHMTLRRLGNVDNRISEKDMLLAFQENHVSLTSRLNQLIVEMFGDHQGIDYERLYKCLVSAHNLTGRDSVKARRKRNDLTSRPQMSQEKRDADFLSRIEAQLIRDQTFFDIDTLRAEFQQADTHRTGKVKMEQPAAAPAYDFKKTRGEAIKAHMMLICQDKTPLYGALLENLLRRCDEDKNETVSWPTLLSFLERGQNSARDRDPELHLLPEKARATAAVNVAPDPIMELSTGARTRLVNSLLRRASRSGTRSAMSNAPSVTSANSSRDPSPVNRPADKNEGDNSHVDGKERGVSFLRQQNAEKAPTLQDHGDKTAKDVEKEKSPSHVGRVNLLTGMKRLLSGHANASKKKEAIAERVPTSDAKVTTGKTLKDVPLIEVDKASECEHLGSETDSKDSTALPTPTTNEEGGVTPGKQPTIPTVAPITAIANSPAVLSTATTTITTPTSTTIPATTTPTTTTKTSKTTPPTPLKTTVNVDVDNSNNDNTNNSNTKNGDNSTIDEEKDEGDVGKMPASDSVKVAVVTGVDVVLPKDFTPPDVPVDPPNERLQLEWVYGCRGNDCRRTIQLLGSGEMVYFISNVCVMLDFVTHTQKHYKEHTEDVKCLAVHSNGILVASGQFASKLRPEHVAHIRVWRSDLLQTTHVLGAGSFSKAVVSLAFMPNKDLLAAVDNSPDKRLSVWDLETQTVIADNYFVTETVCDMEFNPKYPELLVTCGKEHMQWWKLYPQSAKISPFTVPDYESYLKAKYVVCAMHNEKGDLMTGDSNGTVYIWGDGGNRITNFVKHGHDGPVLCVLYHKGCLLTGGRDGNLSAWTWDKNMDKAATLHIPPSEGGVRTLLLREGHLIVSTTMNSLLSVTIATTGPCPLDGVSLDPIPITQGHYDELRALTVIPDSFLQADVLTAGTDGVLCKFNSHSHAPVWKLFMKGMQYLCVDCSTKGDVIVLGTKDGRVLQLEIDQNSLQVMEIVKEKVSTNAILCISLSPDNRWIAAGGEDNSIYLFRLSEQQEEEEEGGAVGWKVWGVLKGHGRQVVCVDWTLQPYTDGVYLLRSCSATPEQKFWNVLTCQEVDGGQLTTLTWASSTCTLDHLVTGVWRSKQAETARVNAMDVSPQHTLVAMGTNQGLLSLYRFPCTKDKVFSHTYSAHQTVQAVRFTPSGHCLFTVGGHDSALFQWKLI